MNKRPLHLSILALTLIVITTSCNRQNVPEFAAGRFHHKEKSVKQGDETTLALQQREKIESIKSKTPEELQSVSQVNEKLRPIAAKNNIVSHSLSSVNRKTAHTALKHIVNEMPVTSTVIDGFRQPATPNMGQDRGGRVLCAVISIFIPFLGVGLYEGIDANFWIDLLLTILFYFPGLIFALIVILSD